MKSQALSELFNYVHAELPGVPDALVWQHLRLVIRDFCKRTRAWQYAMDAISTTADQTDYDLEDWPSCAEFDAVHTVELDNTVLEPGDDYLLVDDDGQPVLRLVTAPSAAQSLEIVVSIMPKMNAEVIDKPLFDRWFVTWKIGIIAALQMSPVGTWRNPQLGMLNRQEYDQQTGKARIYVSRLGVGKQLAVRPRWSFT